MFDYKRFSFALLFFIIILLSTDSNLEKQARKSLLSLFDIVVEESTTVGETAPSSFLETIEEGRTSIYKYLDRQDDSLQASAESENGIFSILFNIAYYIVNIFKFIAGYVIIFYPFIIFLIYIFFTSLLSRRSEFDNF